MPACACTSTDAPSARAPVPPATSAGEAGHLLWAADASQPDLMSRPLDRAEALTLREQQGQIEVGGWAAVQGREPRARVLVGGSSCDRRPACCAAASASRSAGLPGHVLSAPHIPDPPRLASTHPSTQVAFPGAYRCVCVELRISHLAVNAVLEVRGGRALLWLLGLVATGDAGAAEGVTGSEPGQAGSFPSCRRWRRAHAAAPSPAAPPLPLAPHPPTCPQAATIGELEGSTLLDGQHGCAPAFRVLRGLAQSWMDDAARRSNM